MVVQAYAKTKLFVNDTRTPASVLTMDMYIVWAALIDPSIHASHP